MSTLEILIIAVSLMFISFLVCIKLMFESFIKQLKRQSDLTTQAVEHSSRAITLSDRALTMLIGSMLSPQESKEAS